MRKRFIRCLSLMGLHCLFLGSLTLSGAFPARAADVAPIHLAQMDWRTLNPLRPLMKLFKGEEQRRRPANPSAPSSAARTTGGEVATGYSKPRFVEQPKDPDAGILLVIGDDMADGVAEGLKFTLQNKPMVRTEKLIEKGEGLIGGKAPDWSARVRDYEALERVRAVVVMVGQHDLDTVLAGDPPIEFGTDAWDDVYRARIQRLIGSLRGLRKPVIWIGLPPTGSDVVNLDFQRFNDLFRTELDSARSSYVGLWDIFLSDSGDYSSFGPDVSGQRKRLRSGNQIGFTWEGYLKVAFFVERELTRVLGGYGGLAFEGIADDPDFIVLTGRSTSSETDLLGGGEPQAAELDEEGPSHRALVRGDPLAAPAGRVDDWQRQPTILAN